MRTRLKTVAAAVAITGLAVVGTDAVTYAGTGDSLILGTFNKSKQTTHIKTTGKGPALSLHAKGKRPALAVDSKAKIVRLNADQVDGKNAADLQNNVRTYTVRSGSISSGLVTYKLPDIPNGTYQAGYEAFLPNVQAGFCTFYRGTVRPVYAGAESGSISHFTMVALSGSGLLHKTDSDWYLYCAASQPWEINPSFPLRITLTKVDKVTRGQLPAARSSSDVPLAVR